MMEGPDFIGIGMERSGTSWISMMLALHPDIWVPPIKELHYLDSIDPDRLEAPPRYTRHLSARLKQKLAPLMPQLQKSRPELFKNSFVEYAQWDKAYFSGSQNAQWYAALFDGIFTKERVCGEVTPAYSTVSEKVITSFRKDFPKTKYILSVRSPSTRIVSGLIHHFSRLQKRPLENIHETEMLEWLEGPVGQNRSNAVAILQKWSQLVPKNQLYIIRYEDIAQRPQDVIRALYTFIGAPDYLPKPEFYLKKVNSGASHGLALPSSVQNRIDEMACLQDKQIKKYLDS